MSELILHLFDASPRAKMCFSGPRRSQLLKCEEQSSRGCQKLAAELTQIRGSMCICVHLRKGLRPASFALSSGFAFHLPRRGKGRWAFRSRAMTANLSVVKEQIPLAQGASWEAIILISLLPIRVNSRPGFFRPLLPPFLCVSEVFQLRLIAHCYRLNLSATFLGANC